MKSVKGFLPWFYGWNVLAMGIFTAAVVIGLSVYSFTFYVVEWVEEFGGSRGNTMLALSAAQIGAGFLFPFVGRAMDRFPIGWIASCGILIFAVSLVVLTFTQSVWQIIVIYGLFIALVEPLAGPLVPQTLAAKWFVKRRGLAIGLAALGTSIGGFVMPPIVANLILEHGWRTANLYLAPMMVMATVPGLLLIIRRRPEPEGESKRKLAPESISKGSSSDNNWTTREILTHRNFWFVVVGFLPLMEVTTALISNLALWTNDFHIGTQKTAFLMSLLSLTMIIGKVLFGYLADHIEVRTLFFCAVGLLILALFLMIGTPEYPLLLCIVVMIGLSVGGQLPLAGILIGRIFGSIAFGSAMGLFYLCTRPVAFGGPIGGWARDYFGSYDVFWMGAIVAIVIFTPALYFVKTRS
jgi:MFS family permease